MSYAEDVAWSSAWIPTGIHIPRRYVMPAAGCWRSCRRPPPAAGYVQLLGWARRGGAGQRDDLGS